MDKSKSKKKEKRVDKVSKEAFMKNECRRKSDGMYVFTYYHPYTGKRKYLYATSLADLREKETPIRNWLDDSTKPIQKNAKTLNDLFDLYMAGKKNSLELSTRTNYAYMYDHFVRPCFGQRMVVGMTFDDIEMFYRSILDDEKMSISTLNTVHTLVHSALTKAVRKEIISRNPSDGVMTELKRQYKVQNTKAKALSREEEKAFLLYVKHHPVFSRWGSLLLVLLGTGMRIGEAMALRWSDLDDDGMLNIMRTLVYRPSVDNDFHTVKYFSDPKTAAGNRCIPMTLKVQEAFELEAARNRLLGFDDISPMDGADDLIFRNRFGDTLSGKSVNGAIKRIIQHYNEDEELAAQQEGRKPKLLPHITCHSLRHTFASRALERGLSVKEIQKILGHSDYKTTMNVYAHVFEERLKEVFSIYCMDDDL